MLPIAKIPASLLAALFDLLLHRVTQATADAGAGVELLSSELRSGPTQRRSMVVEVGGEGLYIVELIAR